jgi:flagellar biosynthesis protein FlhA
VNDSLTFQDFVQRLNPRQMLAPLLIVMILSMMVLPLPAFALDVLLTFNIAISIMVLLVAMYTRKPLDFAVFPTVLLVTTLLRLSLNVASTRVVLLQGHTGPDAAGKVIEAFGHFLVGGNYAVGIIVFIILTLINFIVITKGAGRIAEVSARFTLDAMPGKQMAIDADLNAGLIGEDEARKRRANVAQESEFYGSMDGASKFVRGDAVAGILILFINIIGGLIVGVVQHDMGAGDAAKVYTLLTIGDGLVAQIPALIISTAAGLVVTRVASDQDVGQQLVAQLFGNPMVLGLTAAILGILGMIPGMPNLVFLLLAGGLGYLAWRQFGQAAASPRTEAGARGRAGSAVENQEASWADVAPVDVLGLEVGYRLIPLVDRNQNGDLLKRIAVCARSSPRTSASSSGAGAHPRQPRTAPNAYRTELKGVDHRQGEAYPGQFLAINPGRVSGTLPGNPTQDPAFGLPAVWIEAACASRPMCSATPWSMPARWSPPISTT